MPDLIYSETNKFMYLMDWSCILGLIYIFTQPGEAAKVKGGDLQFSLAWELLAQHCRRYPTISIVLFRFVLSIRRERVIF